MNPRISLITLGVENMQRAVRFYRDGLGFPQMESPPEVAFFKLTGTWLGLYGRKALAEDASVSEEGGGFKGFALAHNVRSENEVNRIIDEAKTAGAKITKAAQKTSWGGYSGYFADPDGYLWEVAYNPHLWIGPDHVEP